MTTYFVLIQRGLPIAVTGSWARAQVMKAELSIPSEPVTIVETFPAQLELPFDEEPTEPDRCGSECTGGCPVCRGR